MALKKGQVGETVTWVVATVIIIVVLTVSILFSQNVFDLKQVSQNKESDFLASESFYSYLLTKDSEGKTVYEQLKQTENLSEFSGNLALNVFPELYGQDYYKIWLGFTKSPPLPFIKNSYFGDRPSESRGGDLLRKTVPHLSDIIYINENKNLELTLARK